MTLFGPTNPDTLRNTKELALAHGRLGKWKTALHLLEALITSVRDVVTATPELLRIRCDYASALAQLGRHHEAVTELKQIRRDQAEILSAQTSRHHRHRPNTR